MNCGFITYTQGGYGSTPNGNNPGTIVAARFDAAFPNDLVIGCGTHTLRLTSAQAVRDFLPSGSNPGPLTTSYVDPGASYQSEFAGQLVALTLSVGFSSPSVNLGGAYITTGTFSGMTVNQLLVIANNVYGGCSTAYSISQLNSILTAINEAYDGGATGSTLLRCCNVELPAPNVTDVACYGGSTGSFTVAATGGSGYMYSLATVVGGVTGPYGPAQASGTFSNLAAGTYSVRVVDARNCSDTRIVAIAQPSSPLSALASHTNVSCHNGTNGTITLSVTGGTAPYTFNWGGGVTTQNRSGLSAGTYTVTVTDARGCSTTASATITQPSPIVINATPTNVSCFNGNNGAISLAVSGGTAPYTFNWGGGVTTQNRSGLAAGTYTVTVTDASGCSAQSSTTITQPAQLAVTGTSTNVSCNGGSNGSITLSVSGGTTPYTYAWNGGATTQNRSGLAAGTYMVTVTDANGCSKDASFTITQPAPLVANNTHTNVSCHGGSNGTITVSVAGGTSPYTYLWNGGATTQNRSGLAAGTYMVTVTDANGCSTTTSATITQPTPIAATATPTAVTCFEGTNGSISLSVSGGTAPYTFNWGGGVTTQNRSGLAAGTYTVTITDANGCYTTASATITQPARLVANNTNTNVSCNGGSNGTITVSVTGGTAPYTYNWGGGITSQNRTGLAAGTYTVTVTDANGCTAQTSATITQPAPLAARTSVTNVSCHNGTNGTITLSVTGGTTPYTYNWGGGVTTQNRSGLAAGTYNVTVTDANGCSTTASATITQPAPLAVTGTSTNVSCNGGSNGSITLSVSGGTTPYTYAWNGGATTQNRSGLAAGTYMVTVTDANGCSKDESFTITQPTPIMASTTQTNVSCHGGSNGAIDLSVSGGTAPYTYLWAGGATTQDRSNLAAGTYTVTITDARGCTTTASATITQPAPLVASNSHTNVSCNGGSNGTITVSVTGGTAPYSYLWNGGATTQNRSGLAAGTYSVTVTDAHGCTAQTSATITQPAPLTASASSTKESCTKHDGTATATAFGGTPPYTYSWSTSPAQTGMVATGLVAGLYTVTITDHNGCTATASTTVQAENCLVQHCTLTQGGYGNGNGVICKYPGVRRTQLITNLLTTYGDLTIGSGSRTITYSAGGMASTSAQCIIDKMPAGGTAAAFPSNLSNVSGCNVPSSLLKNGNFNNVLIGQTLALSLNIRLDNTLGSVRLSSSMTSYAALNCDGPDNSDRTGITRTISSSVMGYLSYNGATPTVASLLALANTALGGGSYSNPGGSPTLSEISGAVAAINELFDNCRMYLEPNSTTMAMRASASSTGTTSGTAMTLKAAPAYSEKLHAFPNPFASTTALEFALPQAASYQLVVHDISGRLVARVSSGEAQAGVRYTFPLLGHLQEGVYVARLITATGTQTIRLNVIK